MALIPLNTILQTTAQIKDPCSKATSFGNIPKQSLFKKKEKQNKTKKKITKTKKHFLENCLHLKTGAAQKTTIFDNAFASKIAPVPILCLFKKQLLFENSPLLKTNPTVRQHLLEKLLFKNAVSAKTAYFEKHPLVTKYPV